MRVRIGLLLVILVLAGCRGGGPPPPAPPEPVAPTVESPATHPPALGAVTRPSPTSDQARTASTGAPSPSAAASVVPTRAGKPLVYVAIGASETVGVGATDPPRDGWAPQLAQRLGPGSRLRNLGVSGTLLSAALADQLPVAVQERPDLVTVWLAVNDLNAHVPLERYSADLDTLLASLSRQTTARILIGNVPDLTQVPVYKGADLGQLQAVVGRWNVVIAQDAARHGAIVVDLYAGYAELGRRPDYISGDGFHPSTLGYARVAEMFYEAARLVLSP